MGLYLVLLYLFHTTGRKFLSSQCFVLFLVYLKTKNIGLYFYLPASFSELSNCMISDNRGIYDVMSQKTTADSPESQSHNPRPEGIAASMLGCRRWPRWPMQGQHFVRSLVLLWGKLHEHSDKRKKKCLLEIDTTLSSSKAAGRALEASCAGLSWSHHPDMAAPWWDRCWGAMWQPVTVLSQCLALAFIFLIN